MKTDKNTQETPENDEESEKFDRIEFGITPDEIPVFPADELQSNREIWRSLIHEDGEKYMILPKDNSDDPDEYTFKGLYHLNELSTHDDPLVRSLLFDWTVVARPDQYIDFDKVKRVFALCGRRSGKSFMMVMLADHLARTLKPGIQIIWVGQTYPSITQTNLKGDSGFERLMLNKGGFEIKASQGGRHTCYYDNGSRIVFYSAEKPSSMRGGGYNALFADEIAFWDNCADAWRAAKSLLSQPYKNDTSPIIFASTTPPTPLESKGKSLTSLATVKQLWESEDYLNLHFKTSANYLILPSYLDDMRNDPGISDEYFRTEFEAEMMDGNPMDFFKEGLNLRMDLTNEWGQVDNVVISVDPALTSKRSSDNTGIVVAARLLYTNGPLYVIIEAFGTRGHVTKWIAKIAELHQWLAKSFGRSKIKCIVESNVTGEILINSIVENYPPLKHHMIANHESTSKEARCIQPSNLYANKRIIWVKDFPELEKEMHDFNPMMENRRESPGILDAHNQAIQHLVIQPDSRWSMHDGFTGQRVY